MYKSIMGDGKLKGRLKALGFVTEDPQCLLPPERTVFAPKKLWDPSFLYIGRGSSRDGVICSDWANPVSIKEAASRENTLAAFRSYLT